LCRDNACLKPFSWVCLCQTLMGLSRLFVSLLFLQKYVREFNISSQIVTLANSPFQWIFCSHRLSFYLLIKIATNYPTCSDGSKLKLVWGWVIWRTLSSHLKSVFPQVAFVQNFVAENSDLWVQVTNLKQIAPPRCIYLEIKLEKSLVGMEYPSIVLQLKERFNQSKP